MPSFRRLSHVVSSLALGVALCLVFLAAPVAAQPTLTGLQPADGSVLGSGQGALTGTAAGATTLSINGSPVTLGSGGSFSWAFDLPEGPSVIQLYAEDGNGQSASAVHQLVVDTRDPQVTVSQPARSVVGSQPVEVAGTYFEPHLTSLTVAGVAATASGGTWSVSVPLAEGTQTLQVSAEDSLGHQTSFPIALTLDTQAPSLVLTESGASFSGGLFNRAVVPVISASDATELTLDAVLDGGSFVSGTEVSAEGSHTLTVTATDAAGNATTASATFVIDTTPPALGTVQPAAGTVLATGSATLQVETGSGAQAADRVRVTGPSGSAEAVGSGLFTVGPVSLVEGTVDLLIEAFDDAGNRATRSHRLLSDTTPPVLSVTAPQDGDVVSAGTVPAQGTAQDARLQSVTVNGQLANLVGEGWSVADVPLVDGVNVLTIVATDAVGHQTTRTVTVQRDTAAPVFQVLVGGVELVSGATFSGPVTPVIEVDLVQFPGATVSATLDGSPFTSGTEVSSDGSHELSVTVTSAAGVPSTRLFVFTIDQQAPTISEVLPTDGHLQQEAVLSLSGTVSGARLVTVDGQAATLYQGSFSAGPFTLAEGVRTFTIVATGANGLETTRVHTVERDSTPPQVAIGSPADGALVGDRSAFVSGTALDPNLLSVTVNEMPATISASTWSVQGVPLREGSLVLTARAEDRAGNVSEASRTVILDTTAPEIEILEPTSGSLVPDATYEVRGQVSEEHLDRVDVSVTATATGDTSTVRAAVAESADGTSFSVSVPLAAGMNQITATARDLLGQTATATASIERDADAPQVAIVVPSEGSHVNTPSLEVRGTVTNEDGVTVRVNGLVAPVELGTWVAGSVPLSQGENRLLARATDAQGNVGVHTRTVYLDQEAPTFLGADPSSGALALPVGTVFRLEFSEPLRTPMEGSWTLSAGGTPLAATATVDGTELRIAPDQPLPSQTEVVLTLSSALTDRAGNALAAVPAPLVYTTVDVGAPDAPVLDFEPSRFLCAPEVVLTGTAEAGTRVEAAGGASSAWVRASEAGSFLLEVELLAERLNRLELTATDSERNVSPATVVEVVHDCTGPQVSSSELLGQTLTIGFTEAVDESTVTASNLSVRDAAGDLAFTAAASGDSATLTLASAPAGAVLLDVSTGVRDRAGNALAYPYRRLFGDASGAESFVAGTVIDDATGRPLAGATVQITATDGVALGDPLPQQTTGGDGRFLIPVPAGTHDLTAARLGYTPVFRIVTSTAGEGTNVFDPRLTPMSTAVTVGTGGGTVTAEVAADAVPETGSPARLTLPSGALAQASAVSLTQVGEQALAALLPYGWSPRGAVWVESAEDFQSAGSLRLPVRSASGPTPAGTLLYLATLDLSTLQWRVTGPATVADGEVQMSVPSVGAYVAVLADTGPVAPPAPVVGEVLGSSPSPAGGEVASASLAFAPEVVLPTQRARATATYTLAAGAEDAPSGLPLTLVIEEELELLDGSILREAPYRTDLIVYRDDLGAPSSEFWLQPSETARSEPLQLGGETVTILPYGDETVRGNVLGPDGGAVLSDAGDRLDVPAGALAAPAAVVLTRQSAADLPLGAPRGATVDAVLDLDLGDARLQAPAALTIALATAPGTGAEGLLLQVVEVETESGPQTTYRVLAQLAPTTGGWETAPIDASDLAWPGLRSGGQLVAARLTADHGYVRGQVVGSSGQLVDGAVVSSASVDWVQISGPEGRYVLPLPLGDHVVASRSPDTGNAVQVAVTVAAAGERVDLDPTLQVVAPWIAEVSPADGAVGVPVGTEPTVRFSEPVDRTTLAAGLQLLEGGTPLPVEYDHQGDFVRLLPQATLTPGQTYELRIGGEIQDLDGYALNGALTTSFVTEADPSSSGRLDRTKVKTYAPDSQGLVQIVGAAGAVPGGSLVYVENLTSYSTTESVAAAQDGSFQLTIGASLDDRLLLHVLIDGSSEDLMSLGPFLAPDEKAAYVPTTGADWTTSEGLGLEIRPGTFPRATWVRAELRAAGPITTPEGFDRLTNFELDFGGAQAQKSVLVTLAAPGADPANQYMLARYLEALGYRTWMVVDLLRIDGSTLTNARVGEGKASGLAGKGVASGVSTYAVPDRHRVLTLGEATRLRQEPDLVLFDAVVRTRANAARQAEDPSDATLRSEAQPARSKSETPPEDPFQSQVRVLQDGMFEVSYASKAEISWLALDIQVQFLTMVVGGFGAALTLPAGLYAELGLRFLLIPTLKNQPYELEVRDLTTGYQVYRELQPAPTGPLVVFPADIYGDSVPPFPTSGSPIRVHLFVAHEDLETLDLSRGLSIERSGSMLTVRGEPGSVEGEVEVLLRKIVASGEAKQEIKGTSSAAGEFTLQLDGAETGAQYLFLAGAKVAGGERVEISFSEALPDPPTGIELVYLEGDNELPVQETVRLRDNGHRVEVIPTAGWKEGAYRLRLTESLQDVGGTTWDQDVRIRLEVPESQQLGSIETERISDMARLGNLLLAATNSAGLRIYDMTHPNAPRHYLKEDRGLLFPNSNPVRGVDVDSHGRIFMVGGGQSSFGQMKLIDLTKIDPELITDAATWETEVAKGFRGSTLISDPLNTTIDTALRNGLPRRVAVANNDLVHRWVVQEDAPPSGVMLEYLNQTDPSATLDWIEETEIKVSGTGEEPNSPITLRNTTRGRAERTEAAEDGTWELKLKVARYDELVLQRSRGAFAYVAIEGVGVGVVDILDFFDEEITEANTASNIIGYAQPVDVLDRDEPCDPGRVSVSTIPTDLGLIIDAESAVPLSLFSLIQGFGFAVQTAPMSQPDALEKVATFCGAVEDQATLTAMDVIPAYGLDLDGDGEILPEDERDPETGQVVKEKEIRDYVILGHAAGYVLVVDVTDRTQPTLKAQIKLGDGVRISALAADKKLQRIFVSAFGEGVFIVDFSSLPSGDPRRLIDEDGDGEDDRVLETIGVGSQEIRDVFLLPEFGVAWAGSESRLTGLLVGDPEITFLAVDDGPLRRADRVAPFGVPTAPESDEKDAAQLSGIVRLQAVFPGLATSEQDVVNHDLSTLELDLASVGPELGEFDGAGDGEGIPPTHYTGTDRLQLRRMAEKPWEPGYSIYLSEPILTLADLTAAAAYELSTDEKDACERCDLKEEKVYPGGVPEQETKHLKEILSGHYLLARPAGVLAQNLEGFYGESAYGQVQGLTKSVPWDIAPSLRQEPVLSPSYSQSGGLLGTLLHSGEQTWSATDLVVPAVGFDLAFTRHYRSQTVGDGPLGPGWDHSYRQRLRVLPNDDVEFFDGTGRRELFEWDGNAYTSPPGRFVELTRSSAGYTMVVAGGLVYRFDPHGRLRSALSPARKDKESGSEMVFSYDDSSRLREVRVEVAKPEPNAPEPEQEYLVFDYDEDGRLTSVTDSISSQDGSPRKYSYEYTGGLLTRADSPPVELTLGGASETLSTTYAYDTATPTELDKKLHVRDNLASITDAEGDQWIQFQYAAGDDGRYEEIQQQTLTSQSAVSSLTSLWQLEFVSRKPAQAVVTDGRSNRWMYTHAKEGHPTSLTDPTGKKFEWSYKAYASAEHGLVTRATGPDGVIHTTTYQPETASALERPRVSSSKLSFENFTPPTGTGGTEGDEACSLPQDGSNGSATELETTFGGYLGKTLIPGRVTYPGGLEIVRKPYGGNESRVGSLQLTEGGMTLYQSEPEYDQTGLVKRREVSFLSAPPAVSPPSGDFTSKSSMVLRRDTIEYEPNTLRLDKVHQDSGPGGEEISVDYSLNELRLLEAVTSPSGDVGTAGVEAKTEVDFNALGWPLQICRRIRANEQVCTELAYDRNGRLVSRKEPSSAGVIETTYSYGSLGEQVKVRISSGQAQYVESRKYDENLNLEGVDATGSLAQEFTYDDAGRLRKRTVVGAPVPTEEIFEYDGKGRLETVKDAAGQGWNTQYDGFGRPMMEKDPNGNFSLTSYDTAGRPATIRACSSEGKLLAETNLAYDGRGLVTAHLTATEIQDGLVANQEVERFAHNGLGQLVRHEAPSGATQQWTYDSLGRPQTYRTDRSDTLGGYWVDYDLDDRGNVVRETHYPQQIPDLVGPASFVLTRTFDGLDRMRTETNSEDGTWTYTYDEQGQLMEVIPPEGASTKAAYDGLGRLEKLTRPEGIEVNYNYVDGADTRSVTMRDANENVTTWDYDGLGQLVKATYPDETFEEYVRDALGRTETFRRRDATQLTNSFNAWGQIESVQVNGTKVESFSYDGLGRLVSADRPALGNLLTFEYDARSLPTRALSTPGPGVHEFGLDMGYSPSGLRASTTYPSQESLVRRYDPHDQLQAIDIGTPGVEEAAAVYSWWTPSLRAKMATSTDPAGATSVVRDQIPDSAGRPQYLDVFVSDIAGSDEALYGEALGRQGRGLVDSRSVSEAAGSSSFTWVFDTANQLTSEARTYPNALLRATLGASRSYDYDGAQGLIQRKYSSACGETTLDFTVENGSGNEVHSFGGTPVVWTDAGNLESKRDLTFTYDHRDRLEEVSRDGTVVARYEYDALGRRVFRTVNGVNYATVWDGWQPVEEYQYSNGQWLPTERRFHGSGLDEVVRLELGQDPNRRVYTPIYDTSGNMALLLDENQEQVERYFYTPFGERWVWSLGDLPRVEQIRLEGSEILIELSEQIQGGDVPSAVASGEIRVEGLSSAVTVTGSLDGVEGRMEGRRIRLFLTASDPADLPAFGAELNVVVEATALRDTFDGSPAAQDAQALVTWGTDGVYLDVAPPELEEACLTESGNVRLVFSEPLSSGAESLLTLNGATQSWTRSADGYTLTTSDTYTNGSHTLAFADGAYDLAAQPLTDLTPLTFSATTRPSLLALADDASISRTSNVGNPYGFHGLRHEEETGFVFARHRYLDPELGRFLTTDPLGYVDGPNLYQFALNNPVNYSDPMGLYVGETDPNKIKAQQLLPQMQAELTALRAEIARRKASVDKRTQLNQIRQALVDHVHPDEHVYTLAEWSQAAGLNLQDRAALQRAIFTPLGNCETSMEKFTCAGASYTAGVGEIMDISLEIMLTAVLQLNGGGLHTSARGAGLIRPTLRQSLRRMKLPATNPELIGTNTLGETTMSGEIFLRPGLDWATKRRVLRHESVHAFLSVPNSAPLAPLRQRLGMWGYNNSRWLRYVEEAAAETYGSGSLLQGLRHPIVNPYDITVWGLAGEAGVVGVTGYYVYDQFGVD